MRSGASAANRTGGMLKHSNASATTVGERASCRLVYFAFVTIATFSALSAPSLAESHPQRDFRTYQPGATAVRVPSSEAPTIDGDLSDSVWKKAAVIDEFYQLEPNEGNPGSQRTVVRVLYDENNLYFGIMCYADEPSRGTARLKGHDTNRHRNGMGRMSLD